MEGRKQQPLEGESSTYQHQCNSEEHSEKSDKNEGTFICYLCGLEEHYHYQGKFPSFATSIQFLDNSYIMRDPFSPAKPTPSNRRNREVNEPFLILGADCTSCKRPSCRDPECSIFYKHHFCLPCASKYFDLFPIQIQKKLKKK